MPLAITITSVIPQGTDFFVMFNLVASGSYTTGGDTLDFTGATIDPTFVGEFPPQIPTSKGPKQLDVWSQGGNVTQFYVTSLGSALNNNKVLVYTASGSQIAASSYPAGVTGDKITGSAVFSKW